MSKWLGLWFATEIQNGVVVLRDDKGQYMDRQQYERIMENSAAFYDEFTGEEITAYNWAAFDARQKSHEYGEAFPDIYEYFGLGCNNMEPLELRTLVSNRMDAEKKKLDATHKELKTRSAVGYVYLIKHNDLYKIGKTRKPDHRIKTIGVKLPYPVTTICIIKSSDMTQLEACLHKRYEEYRLNGEWFDLPEWEVEKIKKMSEEKS